MPARKYMRGKENTSGNLWRKAIVGILVCGLCAMNFAAPAEADDDGPVVSEAGMQLKSGAGATPNSAPLRETFPEKVSSTGFRVFATNMTALPTLFTEASFTRPSQIFSLPKAALPQQAQAPRHRYWLALGIGGVVVSAAGAGAYAAGGEGICSGSQPSSGCHTTRNVGLALMPVGGVMAVIGFVKYFRH